MNKRKFRFFLTVIVLLISINLYGETFRVHKAIPLKISNFSEKSAEFGINDSVAIFLPEDKTFIQGIELIIQIPKAIADWRDSVAMTLYDNITPVPSESVIDYSGTKKIVTTLPSKLTWIVHIPTTQINSIKDDGYVTKLNIIPDVSSNFVFVRFQPAMKGVPDETYNSTITVTAKPILINNGILDLSIFDADNNSIQTEVTIDESPAVLNNGKIMLAPGNHSISVYHEDFRTETRSVVIEQAKTTEISLTLKSAEPIIKLCAPATAEIFLDDMPFSETNTDIPVSEGEHQIKMLLGGYELIRNINILKGKTYNINLMIDLDISEE